jgi:transcriptional regulator with XRE-family HTH domain
MSKYENGTVRIPVDKLLELAFLYKVNILSFLVGTDKRLDERVNPDDPMRIPKQEFQKQVDVTVRKIEKKLIELKKIQNSILDD